jgi:hypothetical protein
VTFDSDHVFGAKLFGALMDFFGDTGLKNDLGDAIAVAKVGKNDSAVVAATMDPAHEESALAGVGGAKLSAGVGAAKVAKEIEL